MTPIKDYIGQSFVNRHFHFICNCIMNLDIVGTVCDYEIVGTEVVLLVSNNDKIIRIGLNTPALMIKEI